MSPIDNLGSPDADRGTMPEHVQAGRFDGKVAFITGAGSGIGRATARRMAAEGAAGNKKRSRMPPLAPGGDTSIRGMMAGGGGLQASVVAAPGLNAGCSASCSTCP